MKLARPLILASQSPQRLALMKTLGVPFQVRPANINENLREKNPRSLVLKLAFKKAARVAKAHPDSFVLGADTTVACKGRILNKPTNALSARRMLSLLNGSWHRVYTGVTLIDSSSGKMWREVAVTRVKARKLPPDALNRLSGKHMDKAGGYAVQDHKDPFIVRVVGAKDNVIGLPMMSVRRLLRKAGANAKTNGN